MASVAVARMDSLKTGRVPETTEIFGLRLKLIAEFAGKGSPHYSAGR